MRHGLSICFVEFLRIIAVVSISIIFGSMQGSIYFFIILSLGPEQPLPIRRSLTLGLGRWGPSFLSFLVRCLDRRWLFRFRSVKRFNFYSGGAEGERPAPRPLGARLGFPAGIVVILIESTSNGRKEREKWGKEGRREGELLLAGFFSSLSRGGRARASREHLVSKLTEFWSCRMRTTSRAT